MNTKKEKLEVVNENGDVLYLASRQEVHEKGLLHREVSVWLVTQENKLVFQKRSKTKDTNPGLLTASVSGHVDLGMNYEDAAIMELDEEAGISTDISKLTFLGKQHACFYDEKTNTTNNAIRYQYVYQLNGDMTDLVVEQNEGAGFLEYSLEELLNLSEEDKLKFTPHKMSKDSIQLYREILS